MCGNPLRTFGNNNEYISRALNPSVSNLPKAQSAVHVQLKLSKLHIQLKPSKQRNQRRQENKENRKGDVNYYICGNPLRSFGRYEFSGKGTLISTYTVTHCGPLIGMGSQERGR